MNWPISCVDNFFDDPYKVVEFSKKLITIKVKMEDGLELARLRYTK